MAKVLNAFELEEHENENSDAPRMEDTPDVARWQMRQLNPEYSFYFASDGEEGLMKTLPWPSMSARLSSTERSRRYGYTTTEYILHVRISLAKHLLAKTDYSIGDVATRVGIDDVAYFSSVFRK